MIFKLLCVSCYNFTFLLLPFYSSFSILKKFRGFPVKIGEFLKMSMYKYKMEKNPQGRGGVWNSPPPPRFVIMRKMWTNWFIFPPKLVFIVALKWIMRTFYTFLTEHIYFTGKYAKFKFLMFKNIKSKK